MTEVEAPKRTSPAAWSDLPTPAKMEAYEKVCPGTAERMLGMVAERLAHQEKLQLYAVRTRLVGYCCALLSVLTLALLSAYFVRSGAPTQGAAIVVTGAVSLGGIFVTGRSLTRSRSGDSRDET